MIPARTLPLFLPLLLALACSSDPTSTLPEDDAGNSADTGSIADTGGTTDLGNGPLDTGGVDDAGVDVDLGVNLDAEVLDDGVSPDAGQLPPNFSFFVTSLEAMVMLSGSNDGFGGNLSYGGATGLEGADRICAAAAELGLPGAGAKTWRAFLSTSTGGPNGGPINAIDRVGSGPWYDRNGRLVAQDLAGLRMTRPAADTQIRNDLPNERGESQRSQPGPNPGTTADNHDVLTGSNAQGQFQGGDSSVTCNDWTSTDPGLGRPNCGHSWPAMSGQSWMRAHPVAGCAAVVNLVQNGPGAPNCVGVGCGGGYGALYCFALEP